MKCLNCDSVQWRKACVSGNDVQQSNINSIRRQADFFLQVDKEQFSFRTTMIFLDTEERGQTENFQDYGLIFCVAMVDNKLN
jgi:hypothetical protein